MRRLLVAGVLALALAGCGATADATRDAVEAPASAGAAVERCTERLLGDVQGEELTAEEEEAARRYVESTYCARFAERGWVYDDGALSIDAHTWATEGGEEVCEEALSEQQEGETAGSTRTVPCASSTRKNPGSSSAQYSSTFERARFANTWMGSNATAASSARTAPLSPTSARNSRRPRPGATLSSEPA